MLKWAFSATDPPLPLSHVPSACGYTIEGNPLRVAVHVPYDGCNVAIEVKI